MRAGVVCLSAIGMMCALFAYPTMEEARRLFPLNTPSGLWGYSIQSEVSNFCRQMSEGASVGEEIEMEAYLIAAITSTPSRVETNGKMTSRVRPYPTSSFDPEPRLLRDMKHFQTNLAQCAAVAAYVGTFRREEPPKELFKYPVPETCLWSNGTSGIVMVVPDPKLRAESDRRHRELQRYADRNKWIGDRRRLILRGLNKSVLTCYEILPPAEFTSYTNRLVELSGASPIDQEDCLFWMLGK